VASARWNLEYARPWLVTNVCSQDGPPGSNGGNGAGTARRGPPHEPVSTRTAVFNSQSAGVIQVARRTFPCIALITASRSGGCGPARRG
jgi:hypothetical protein